MFGGVDEALKAEGGSKGDHSRFWSWLLARVNPQAILIYYPLNLRTKMSIMTHEG